MAKIKCRVHEEVTAVFAGWTPQPSSSIYVFETCRLTKYALITSEHDLGLERSISVWPASKSSPNVHDVHVPSRPRLLDDSMHCRISPLAIFNLDIYVIIDRWEQYQYNSGAHSSHRTRHLYEWYSVFNRSTCVALPRFKQQVFILACSSLYPRGEPRSMPESLVPNVPTH